MAYLDFQLLLYVPAEHYEACRTFYERVFSVQPFYGWDEGIEDRGVKYNLSVLRNCAFPAAGTSTGGYLSAGTGYRCRHAGAFLPSLRLAHVPHSRSSRKSY